MFHNAKKVVVITEKLIVNDVIKIIEAEGGTGYTVHRTGGKGSRGIRSQDRPRIVDGFANVQIDVITTEDVARRIADRVAETFFANYSGITYLEDVEILRPSKFASKR